MSVVYNGCIVVVQKEGVKLVIVWFGSFYDLEYWVVVKGMLNKVLVEKFIVFVSQLQMQKVFFEQIFYGLVYKGILVLLLKMVQEVLLIVLVNFEGVWVVDVEFWVDYGEELEQCFNVWVVC